MCTAAAYQTKDFYFGRTLDHDCSYGEEVVITPRGYSFSFRHAGGMDSHYAMIGTACVAEGYPLYYDAANEKGLSIAGLHFVGNACYKRASSEGKGEDVAQFELIPFLLGQCASVGEARALLSRVRVTDTPFRGDMPPAGLHWLLADRREAVVVEPLRDGLRVYDNPVGILTNNPPFEQQLFRLNAYMSLSAGPPENRFARGLSLTAYSRGMGALGLPGDLSSGSRFVRAAFVKLNSVSGDSEEESVSQFFHILGAVEQQRGCCRLEGGGYEVTLYTSCCNASRGIYYYTTYGNRQITAVDMRRENLSARALIRYPMERREQIRRQN